MRLGRGTREIFDAESLLEEYVSPRRGGTRYAYPHYDGLVTNGDPGVLCTGDLLAPSLLGVPVDPLLMDTLTGLLPALQKALEALPPDIGLAEADSGLLGAVAAVWAPLDELDAEDRELREVKGSLIAKVLHRKRPALLPLFDSRVAAFYRGDDCIPADWRGERSWVDYAGLLVATMADDLRSSAEEFERLRAVAPADGPELTPLRVLDIVIWMSSGL